MQLKSEEQQDDITTLESMNHDKGYSERNDDAFLLYEVLYEAFVLRRHLLAVPTSIPFPSNPNDFIKDNFQILLQFTTSLLANLRRSVV